MAPTKKLPTHRQALADAIVAHRDAVTERRHLETARDRAQAMVSSAEEKLSAARLKVEAERERHRDNIRAAARTGANTATAEAKGVREARAAEVTAQDDLEAAQEALKVFEAELRVETNFSGKPVDPVSLAAEAITIAAHDVVKAEAGLALPRMIEEANRAVDEATAARARIVQLVAMGAVPDEFRKAVREACAQRANVLPAISCNGGAEEFRMSAVWPCDPKTNVINVVSPQIAAFLDEWARAFEALCRSADAPIPISGASP